MLATLKDTEHVQFESEGEARGWAAAAGITFEPGPRGATFMTVPAGVLDEQGKRSYIPAGSDISFIIQLTYDDAFVYANPLPPRDEFPDFAHPLYDEVQELGAERTRRGRQISGMLDVLEGEGTLDSTSTSPALTVALVALSFAVAAFVLALVGVFAR